MQQVAIRECTLAGEVEPLPPRDGEERSAPDISYRASWPKSICILSVLIEEVAFGREHDGNLKLGIRSRKVPEEVIEYERFKDFRVEPWREAPEGNERMGEGPPVDRLFSYGFLTAPPAMGTPAPPPQRPAEFVLPGGAKSQPSRRILKQFRDGARVFPDLTHASR